MTEYQWQKLMKDDNEPLTQIEIADGWHFCHDFDGLLVGSGMEELHYCHCDESA